jgi:hypothetical protein
MNRVMSMVVWCGAMVVMAVPASAQEVVTGPPPVLRQNLDAFLKGFNAAPADYEAMAKATFSPAFYKSQTPEQRATEYKKLRADFGTIQFQRVERQGPDAPLEIEVKGSVASGTFWIELDENHRVAGIRARAGLAPPAGDLLTYKGSHRAADPCWDVVQR